MLNYHYDMDARLSQQTTVGVHEQTYAYDLNSNIEQIIQPLNPSQNQTLNYDTLDRLIQADQGSGSNVLNYAYDPTGNRQSKTNNGQTDMYSYIQGSHRLDSINGHQPQNYSYDPAGNPIRRNSDTFIYNQAGRLARIETASQTIEYRYNAQGQRTLKYITAGSDTQATLYVYNLEGLLIAELNNTGETQVEYAYLNNQPLSQINAANAEIFYYHNDHLGAPEKLTNSQGTIVWQATYSPFGQATVNEDPDGDENNVTQNIRFPGQYFDQETGLHYNWNRYYDPTIGKYTTSDPIGLEGGINTYLYANANPLKYIDPYGLNAIVLPRPIVVPRSSPLPNQPVDPIIFPFDRENPDGDSIDISAPCQLIEEIPLGEVKDPISRFPKKKTICIYQCKGFTFSQPITTGPLGCPKEKIPSPDDPIVPIAQLDCN